MAEFEAPGQQEVTIEAAATYQLRLSQDGSYKSDLGKIRDAIRANGTKQVLGKIQLISPFADASINVWLNFAFQSNGAMQGCNASLYMLVFEGANNTQWRFKVDVPGLDIPGTQFPINGSYGEFGWPIYLPSITKMRLENAIHTISKFTGQLDANNKTDLARVVITVSEAIRFSSVQAGILSVLVDDPDAQYNPVVSEIKNWGGHTLGDYNLLEDQ